MVVLVYRKKEYIFFEEIQNILLFLKLLTTFSDREDEIYLSSICVSSLAPVWEPDELPDDFFIPVSCTGFVLDHDAP